MHRNKRFEKARKNPASWMQELNLPLIFLSPNGCLQWTFSYPRSLFPTCLLRSQTYVFPCPLWNTLHWFPHRIASDSFIQIYLGYISIEYIINLSPKTNKIAFSVFFVFFTNTIYSFFIHYYSNSISVIIFPHI